ncbi:MAG: hypothetical protein H6747_14340 [Deltaproteobacteria bacterium]|nr:hypothetical protein [Deltaproteobacteria bacterium]
MRTAFARARRFLSLLATIVVVVVVVVVGPATASALWRSVDLLDLPAAQSLPQGTIFASGTSVGFAPAGRLLLAVDLAELVGLNRALTPDPNLRLRVSVARQGHDAGAGASGETALELGGWWRTPLASRRTDQRVVYADGRGAGVYVVESVETLGSRWARIWEPRTWTPTLPRFGGETVRRVYRERSGWLLRLDLVQRLRLPLAVGAGEAPRAVQLHGGASLGLSAVHLQGDAGWGALPAWRLFAGVDIDLSERVRLLASVRYDPDHWNALTRTPALGVDTGVQIRISGSFALQVHAQPGFIGVGWQR